MKGKVLASLFALPFAGVGVWMLWSVSSTLYSSWQMRDWVPVEAVLTSAGYETHSGDDSDTYEAYAGYRYEYGGRTYMGQRVSTASGADNIGDYQQDIGRWLAAAHSRDESIIVYVDASNPSRSIIDRSVRWGLVGFKMIFVVVFGGVGFGILYAVWRAPAEKDQTDPAYENQPWLLNDDWQSATIRSGSRAAMLGSWLFAIFWNVLSAITPFLAYQEIVEKGNHVALVALLFPLVGIGLLAWAIRRTLEWRRFGPAPVTLDPFPGSIGGHVGGTIDLNLPFDPNARFRLTLTNIHSYVSGSGKNRSRNESAKWQDAIVARAEPGTRGTRLSFRFDVPEGLRQSDAIQESSYYLWRLDLSADIPGTDLDRSYELPVYATAEQSRFLSGHAMERARAEQHEIDEQAVRGIVNLGLGPTGKRLYFPMGRFFGPALGGILVGLIFTATGWFLVTQEDQTIFGSIFGGLGALIGLWCCYLMFNSLEVRQTGTGIRTIRRFLGIPIGSRELQRNEIIRLSRKSTMKTQSAGKHIVYYNVYAVDRDGRKHVVGEGFRGESEANAAIELIGREFGIRAAAPPPTDDAQLMGPEVLG